MSDTSIVSFEVLNVEALRGSGRLVALAVLRLDLDGLEFTLQGVQVTRTPAGLTVQAPQFRHPRDGRWLPAVLLPPELREAIGREVLGCLEAKVVVSVDGATRSTVETRAE